MNKTKALALLVLLLTPCLLIVLPKAMAQKDKGVQPQVAVPDPCSFSNPPSYCTPAPTPKDERKGVALGPASVLSLDGIMGDQDLRGPTNRKSNLEILNETGTAYVRLWIDFAALQPSRSSTNTIRTNPSTKPLIESLDGQIVEARKNGLKVILTVHHRYPTWVVWYRGNTRPSGSCIDTNGDARAICKRVPEELDKDSPWGRFIGFLVREYGFNTDKDISTQPDYNRYVDFLEIVNEPNLTHIPVRKRTEGGRLVIALNVADMFVTAQRIVRERNAVLRDADKLNAGATTIKLAGPATADTLMDGKLTNYQAFTEELLLALKRRDFDAGEWFIWTHHAYKDMEEQRNCAPGDSGCARTPHCADYDERLQKRIDKSKRPLDAWKTNSAAWVERKLDVGYGGYKWSGMRDNNGDPAIFITESGVRLDQVVNIYWCYLGLPEPVKRTHRDFPAFAQAVKANMDVIKDWQAGLVESSFNRMSQWPLSKGILLIQNYLTYTDPVYDTGMFDFVGTCADWESNRRTSKFICTGENGSQRPLFEKWKSLRTP